MLEKSLLKGQPFLVADEIGWEQTGSGLKRKILGHDEQVMMVIVQFEKGAVGSLHHHIHRQVSYIASGKFEVTIDGKQKILKQGDCFFIAPDLVHGVVAFEEGTLVDVFTPSRGDFL